MLITFRREALNEIMKRCKPFVLGGSNPNHFPESMRGILIEKTGRTAVEVTAMDGFMLLHFTVGVDSQAAFGSMVIPLVKPFKDDYINVIYDEEQHTITFATVSGSSCTTHSAAFFSQFPYKDVLPEMPDPTPCDTVYMDPSQLKRAMNAFTGAVKVELWGPKRGVFVKNKHGDFAWILPVNPSKANF